MQIDVLHLADCPHLALVRARVDDALTRVGAAASVREIEVTTTEEAQQVGMRGSPTILIDGHDPFESGEASLACRLYRAGPGSDGAPGVTALMEALSR